MELLCRYLKVKFVRMTEITQSQNLLTEKFTLLDAYPKYISMKNYPGMQVHYW